ncbi:hypothetical protein NDU88_003315 [Pleurodeles waltl]|uniref:Uncharacterized protein n=1 Tax=Pleurodeles waltl TaxID=8319 RepID=A0AAV7TNP0_PLEWA|nr:hypothetical protein NDU88_003315 [Pleurodeles waltl]
MALGWAPLDQRLPSELGATGGGRGPEPLEVLSRRGLQRIGHTAGPDAGPSRPPQTPDGLPPIDCLGGGGADLARPGGALNGSAGSQTRRRLGRPWTGHLAERTHKVSRPEWEPGGAEVRCSLWDRTPEVGQVLVVLPRGLLGLP